MSNWKNVNRRRFGVSTVACLVAAFSLVLAACGSPETETATDPGPDPVVTDPTDTPDDATENGDDWEEVEELARQEGSLVLYTSTHDGINIPEIEAFNQQYPEISVSHVRMNTDELTTRFASETEAGASSGDVVKMADARLLNERSEWFVDLDESVIPNLVDLASQFQHDVFFEIVAGQYVLTYNTDLIDEPPTDFCSVTDEQYRGMVGLNTPSPGAGHAAWVEILETCGEDFLVVVGEAVGAEDIRWYSSAATAQQELAAGEFGIVGHGQASHSKELRDQGAPVDYVYVENPPIALAHRIGIAENASSPNAARVYANWLLSREGQLGACQGEYQSLVFDDLEDCPPPADGVIFADTEKGAAAADQIDELLQYTE